MANKVEILKSLQEAVAKGDVDSILSLTKELKTAEANEAKAQVEAARQALESTTKAIGTALADVHASLLAKDIILEAELVREDGKIVVKSAYLRVPSLTDLIYAAYDFETVPALVKRIKVNDQGVELITKATKSQAGKAGGSKGKGWSKNGESMKLGDIWDKYATPEEKTKYESEDNNAQYTMKMTVAKRAGYKKNS